MDCRIIIPARFASSRFPGKPLVPLLGRAMILRVADIAAEAVGADRVHIATDDARIAGAVRAGGYDAVMTGPALTGTDRAAEAAARLPPTAIVLNVQGDEPLLDPADIRRIAAAKAGRMEAVINGFCWLGAGENPADPALPKVVAAEDGRLLYMSRAPVPAVKDPASATPAYRKQVCIYAFTPGELAAFRAVGRKSALEQVEDIEILRCLELGQQVQMVETAPGSLAVDRPQDVAAVEEALQARLG